MLSACILINVYSVELSSKIRIITLNSVPKNVVKSTVSKANTKFVVIVAKNAMCREINY